MGEEIYNYLRKKGIPKFTVLQTKIERNTSDVDVTIFVPSANYERVRTLLLEKKKKFNFQYTFFIYTYNILINISEYYPQVLLTPSLLNMGGYLYLFKRLKEKAELCYGHDIKSILPDVPSELLEHEYTKAAKLDLALQDLFFGEFYGDKSLKNKGIKRLSILGGQNLEEKVKQAQNYIGELLDNDLLFRLNTIPVFSRRLSALTNYRGIESLVVKYLPFDVKFNPYLDGTPDFPVKGPFNPQWWIEVGELSIDEIPKEWWDLLNVSSNFENSISRLHEHYKRNRYNKFFSLFEKTFGSRDPQILKEHIRKKKKAFIDDGKESLQVNIYSLYKNFIPKGVEAIENFEPLEKIIVKEGITDPADLKSKLEEKGWIVKDEVINKKWEEGKWPQLKEMVRDNFLILFELPEDKIQYLRNIGIDLEKILLNSDLKMKKIRKLCPTVKKMCGNKVNARDLDIIIQKVCGYRRDRLVWIETWLQLAEGGLSNKSKEKIRKWVEEKGDTSLLHSYIIYCENNKDFDEIDVLADYIVNANLVEKLRSEESKKRVINSVKRELIPKLIEQVKDGKYLEEILQRKDVIITPTLFNYLNKEEILKFVPEMDISCADKIDECGYFTKFKILKLAKRKNKPLYIAYLYLKKKKIPSKIIEEIPKEKRKEIWSLRCDLNYIENFKIPYLDAFQIYAEKKKDVKKAINFIAEHMPKEETENLEKLISSPLPEEQIQLLLYELLRNEKLEPKTFNTYISRMRNITIPIERLCLRNSPPKYISGPKYVRIDGNFMGIIKNSSLVMIRGDFDGGLIENVEEVIILGELKGQCKNCRRIKMVSRFGIPPYDVEYIEIDEFEKKWNEFNCG